MISRVRFQNFKALADVAIDLPRLTVLVGANGAGKTSVLEGLDLMTQLAVPDPPDEAVAGQNARVFRGRSAPERLRTLGTDAPIEIHLLGDVELHCRVSPGAAPDSAELVLSRADPKASPDITAPTYPRPRSIKSPTTIGPALRLRFDPARLSEPSYVDEELPRVHPDGSGLASVLAQLAGQRSELLDRIEADLRTVIPRARRIRTTAARITRTEHEVLVVNGTSLTRPIERTYSGQRFELEMAEVGFIPAEQLSEGTILLLGLLTVLHTTPALELLMLDDLERGLHPNAQRDVVRCIRTLLHDRPYPQFVCTTHSPYALDIFEPDEVRVLKLDRRGHAHCRALTEHPDWPRWQDLMNAGEFWSSVGEEWVFSDHDEA